MPPESLPDRNAARAHPRVKLARTLALLALALPCVALANDLVLLVPTLLVHFPLTLWVLAGTLAALVLGVSALFGRESRGEQVAWLTAVVALNLGTPLALWQIGWPLRTKAFARACDRARPVADAVGKYQADHHELPPSLDALVPAYLPAVPWTGLPAYPRFEYARGRSPGGEIVWWDLGDRGGRPMRGLWVYPDGPPGHAILVLTFDEQGGLVEARTDRLPEGVSPAPFDGARWSSGAADRMAMALGLSGNGEVLTKGRPRAALIEQLGPPDGARDIIGAPWELWVSTPTGMINFDGLLYFPTGRYPQRTHGGRTEPIGACVYVHD